jgi:hypothetical protein
MRIDHVVLVVALAGWYGPASCQSQAALDQLLAHHAAADVAVMQNEAHFRYEGELLFYAESFLIEENGLQRAATEAEIATIDLHAYDGVRLEGMRTGVHDPLLDKHVVLLSKLEFEQVVLGRLSHADRDAYLAYKDRVLVRPPLKTH